MSDPVHDQTTPDATDGAGGPNLLPFAFARRFGVVITEETGPNGQAVVACKTQPALTTLAEIKRFARRTLQLSIVSEEEFEVIVGTLQAIASIGGNPKPSSWEG